MTMTKHCAARMSQRGITQEMVDLVRCFGGGDGDRVQLDRRGLKDLLAQTRYIERVAKKLLDKGGVTVVEAGDSLVTTYNVDGYRRRKTKHKNQRGLRFFDEARS